MFSWQNETVNCRQCTCVLLCTASAYNSHSAQFYCMPQIVSEKKIMCLLIKIKNEMPFILKISTE